MQQTNAKKYKTENNWVEKLIHWLLYKNSNLTMPQ